MDLLKEMIDGLEEKERKEFKTFANRFRKKLSRVDLKLFNLYCRGEKIKRENVISELYEEDSKVEAYHGTRKRLIKQLVEFIPHQMKSAVAESERSVENLLTVAKFLFEKQRDQAGWAFLKQAGELAKKTENFNLLNIIYSIQIEKYRIDLPIDLKQIIQDKEKYQKLAMEDDNANIAYQLIRHELEKSKQEGKDIDLDKIIKKVLQEYNLDKEVLDRPKLIHNLIAITRSARLSRKEFYLFEPYIESRYKRVESKGYFNEYNHSYKLNMLYMLAHVKYRNKKFEEALYYLDKIKENIYLYHKSHYFTMYPKYIVLLAAVKAYSGNNSEAIELLEDLLSNKKFKPDHSLLLNANLNLVTYYFQKEDYSKAIRQFMTIHQSDKWLSKTMGREWVLKKCLSEILIQYELGNHEIVDNRIKSIRKNFKDIFHIPIYKRVEKYVSLVKVINDNPNIATTAEYRMMIEKAFDYVSMEEEDLQATTAFCWIKAKSMNKKYYDVLVHTVNFRARMAEKEKELQEA